MSHCFLLFSVTLFQRLTKEEEFAITKDKKRKMNKKDNIEKDFRVEDSSHKNYDIGRKKKNMRFGLRDIFCVFDSHHLFPICLFNRVRYLKNKSEKQTVLNKITRQQNT